MARPKEQAEGDPEGSMVLRNISTIPNYNLSDFLEELIGASHRTLLSHPTMRASQVHSDKDSDSHSDGCQQEV